MGENAEIVELWHNPAGYLKAQTYSQLVTVVPKFYFNNKKIVFRKRAVIHLK